MASNSASDKPPRLARGDVILGTYEILFHIGSGAFGDVYRVQHKHLGVQVLKLLKEEYASKADIGEVLHEASLLAKVTHPNVVRVFEANSFDWHGRKRYFLTMGFVSGETLTQLLGRRMSLPRAEAVRLMIGVLEGLAHVHGLRPPVIHRDINPDNVLLSYDGDSPVAMLSDFGLARSFDKDAHLPGAAGRYPYMAPECFFDSCLLPSDVFSAGVVLYRMLVALHPWPYELDWLGNDPEKIVTEVARARKSKARPPSFHIAAEDADSDAELDTIVMKAIDVAAERRYRNADDFLKALKNWLLARSNPSSMCRDHEPAATSPGTVSAAALARPAPGRGLAAVAGMHELKKSLEEEVLGPMRDPELYREYGVKPPNGMLLFGPPGCGKTFIARRLAEELGFHFIEVLPSSVASTYIHGTQEKIAAVFKEARRKAPSLIFFDEIDAMVPRREGLSSEHVAGEVNELLAQTNNAGEQRILVVAATNRPERVDPALLRTGRIDRVIYLPPPDVFGRTEMLKMLLLDRRLADDIDFVELAQLSEGYVSSDMSFLVNEAARAAMKEREPIGAAHFKLALRSHKPSISREQVRSYERFRDQRTFGAG